MKVKTLILPFLAVSLVIFQTSCEKEEENKAPTCSITSPSNGAEFEQGLNITISVDAEDPDGEITEVRYFIDDIDMGVSTKVPYKYEWNTDEVDEGAHTIKAIAKDNEGKTTSTEISVLITSVGNACEGIESITYEGQTYHTVEIGSQCWLKKNLNIGTIINGNENMSDNSTIEKYCYDDDEANCDTYGGLYQWDEAMQYSEVQGSQGICPDGWHIPTDEEWKILEGTVDTQYGVGDSEWDNTDYRGYDAGKRLKSTSGWDNNGNGTDTFGFSAFPGGFRNFNGAYSSLPWRANFWSSTEYNSGAWCRDFGYDTDKVDRYYDRGKDYGFSIRCLKD